MTSINNQLLILTFLHLPRTSVIANHFPLGNLVHVASEIPLGLRIPHWPLLRVLSWFLLNLQSLDVGAPQGLVLRCFVACLHYTLGDPMQPFCGSWFRIHSKPLIEQTCIGFFPCEVLCWVSGTH